MIIMSKQFNLKQWEYSEMRIRSSTHYIAFLSKDFFQSINTEMEFSLAKQLKKDMILVIYKGEIESDLLESWIKDCSIILSHWIIKIQDRLSPIKYN